MQDENGIWRIRKNHELNELIGNSDIVRFIQSRRMAWLGHVMRMDGGRMPRRILECISRRWDVGMWTGLGWPRIGTGGVGL